MTWTISSSNCYMAVVREPKQNGESSNTAQATSAWVASLPNAEISMVDLAVVSTL